ncbi:hypothetical protein AX25_05700 [Listeria ivanovii WSLC3009]|nr:hypothetical protein AX25_05700 [Listeria ivanovii WSLC3009]
MGEIAMKMANTAKKASQIETRYLNKTWRKKQ